MFSLFKIRTQIYNTRIFNYLDFSPFSSSLYVFINGINNLVYTVNEQAEVYVDTYSLDLTHWLCKL